MQRFPFGLEEFRAWELSTQVLIKAARARGLEIEALDRVSNTVRLRDPASGRSEIVVQATKTSRDNYVCTEIMGLKNVTKILLHEAGLRVPQGLNYQSLEQALGDFATWTANLSGFIVKPNSTNYGIGISRLASNCARQDYQHALEVAFTHDSSVLVEEFIPGKEYRFLVIDGKLRAVLHRRPANVTGDGYRSISQLIEQKNRDPWRIGPQGGHSSPLETIELNATELGVLRQQGFRPDSVPQAGQLVLLRQNSNISTGGDSLDMTDQVHSGYGRLAETCARTLGARICGVDIMSANITAAPARTIHAIIEANFNPVLYFHEYPAVGQPRSVAAAVVELLFGPASRHF